MIIARWQIDARFGHKQTVIEAIQRWSKAIGATAGFTKGRLLSGSIGALEATVENDWEVASLLELEQAWTKLGSMDAHKQWSKDLEPYVVSGTARWSVFRVI
jgi:hypothetical protein